MTIPQGDNRGPQSVSDRRKVTFAGDSPSSGSLPSKPSTPPPPPPPHRGSSQDTATNAGVDTSCSLTLKDHPDSSPAAPSPLSGAISQQNKTDKIEKDLRNQHLYDKDHLEVNVKVVSPSEPKKSSLPLLNFFRGDGGQGDSDRSRKLSLNLPKSNPKQSCSSSGQSERSRRYSQPQKSYYQRVPLEDPSPPSSSTQAFPVHDSDTPSPSSRPRPTLSTTQSAEVQVHASFNDKDRRLGIQSCSRNTPSSKKVFFGKQKPLSSSRSSSFRSLDDLALSHHGVTSGKSRGVPSNRSVSSEDLSASRIKRVAGTGGSGGNHPRRDPHPSPGSPSGCCLVSVSRVPMAAATSHLTLDSEYQTVRLAVLGAPGVGKSSIVRQFVMQQFSEEYVPTEQRQIFCPAVIINEHLYEVRIIDCPYIPYFPVNSLYEWTDFRGYGLRNATAYVLVYDITSEESFEYIKSLRLQILESRNKHDVPIFVVGNKHDLAEERGVPRREVREISNLVKKQWKCGYIECSAKYNWHIMLLFKELMKTVDYIDYGHKPTSMRVQDALRRNRCLIL